MGTTLFLLGCALTTAQPAQPEPTEWLLLPQLVRGQELVYRGAFREESLTAGVQFDREYRLENRVLILDSIGGQSGSGEVAFLTTLRLKSGRPERVEPAASSVRLEVAKIDRQGRILPDSAGSLLAPLEGPPTIECGAFVQAPLHRVRRDQSWEAEEPGRTGRTWRILGTEAHNGTVCVKLEGIQQSADWDQPRADRTAWRRQDTVWLAARTGLAQKVERAIERREPARTAPTQRSVLKYELENSLQYPPELHDDRRREVQFARSVADALTPLLPRAGQVGPKPFEALLAKINHHLQTQPPTPYREVLRQLQLKAEAGKRGESPPVIASEEETELIPVAGVGRTAPDFLVRDFTTNESARMRRWLGKPMLMVFYNPTAASAEEVLLFGQSVGEAWPQQVQVLGLAMSDDAERVQKQRAELKLAFPLLSGGGLRHSYGVEATPKLIVLDSQGVVRGSYLGWGPETPQSVTDELKRCLAR